MKMLCNSKFLGLSNEILSILAAQGIANLPVVKIEGTKKFGVGSEQPDLLSKHGCPCNPFDSDHLQVS